MNDLDRWRRMAERRVGGSQHELGLQALPGRNLLDEDIRTLAVAQQARVLIGKVNLEAKRLEKLRCLAPAVCVSM
jgi:hypothetical protein